MDEKEYFDAIVVGAGVIGSSAAYHLVKNGQKTLLLEQFPLPHIRGSSHGHSRTLRKAYTSTQWYYSRMVPDAVQLWRKLEEEAQAKIFNQIGVLSVAFDPKTAESAEKSMQKADVNYVKLDSTQLRQQYPMIRVFDNSKALVEPDGGAIYADKAVASFQKIFRQNGGVIHESERVVDVVPADTVTVKTNKSEYRCSKLVITVGAWAGKMLKPLGLHVPLQPWRVSVLYWRMKRPCGLEIDRFPILRFIHAADGHTIYSVPCAEYPGMMKLDVHYGVPVDPDNRDKPVDDWDIRACSQHIKRHLPDVEDKPAIVERGIYTMTPDSDYILDTHPRFKNIVIGAGFSGHGFKLAPISGQLLCQLALGETPKYDMRPFKITRFAAGEHLFKAAI